MLGLICDPVAGLVEVPCVKRNAMGASFAFIAADMALAGIESKIPVDEVIDAMYQVGGKHANCLSLKQLKVDSLPHQLVVVSKEIFGE